MDSVTQTIVNYIEQTDVTNREDLLTVARIAFLDYLASLAPAEEEQAVQDLARFIGVDQNEAARQGELVKQGKLATVDGYESNATVKRADKALYYGFASHYLDFDDAQANLAGHFSTVLYSALLAVIEPTDTWHDFLRAYIIGAELEGIIGSLINPAHRTQGWHSTGTVGVIGAAAAIGALRGLHGESLAQLLSLAATQSAGMFFQSGTDGKPLHAGLAARNGVWAYELLQHTSLQTSTKPFDPERGWFKTIGNITVTSNDIVSRWLAPGQLIDPGLWMKVHPYCSAAICGAEATETVAHRIYTSSSYVSKHYNVSPDAEAQGKRRLCDTSDSLPVFANREKEEKCNLCADSDLFLWDDIERVTVHFPPGADAALRYTAPSTGREGQFSIEYIVYQVLAYGAVQDELFKLEAIDPIVRDYMKRIERVHDLPKVAQSERITKITVTLKNGDTFTETVNNPKGSPNNPLTMEDIRIKLGLTLQADQIDRIMEAFTRTDEVEPFLQTLRKEGVLHV
ncbi:MAG: MmgE/PrpD family protein [Veillonella sp.]|nr:MmgE/PrpD family protein [Veillonella sp.]